MARKTVRVDVPRTNPDTMLLLIKNINSRHQSLGNKSPLDKEDTTALSAIQSSAQPEREQAKDFEAKAKSHNERARKYLGINNGQGRDVQNTGLYYIAQVRDTLLKKYKGNEEELAQWGFNVVIGSAKDPTRKPKNQPSPKT